MHMGPNDILLAISIDFKDDMTAVDVERKIGDLEREIKSKYSEIKHLFIEVQKKDDHDADENSAQPVA
jgi:divalent metal cation (Fe/Co/Zn/Cd) transporter